jgi:glycosyltransferase involved in cell wall biosynthesis
MTTLLFHVSTLLDEDIQKVLVNILQELDPAKYKMRLSVAHSLGELELVKSRVPQHVEVHYILNTNQSATTRKRIEKTITITDKVYDALVMPLVRRRMHGQKLGGLAGDTGVVIDFDMSLAPYTNLFRDKKKVAWCHHTLAHYWDGDRAKLRALANTLVRYDKVIMLCDEMKETAIQLQPSLQERLVTIYSGFDNERIQTLAQQPLTGHEYLLDDGYFVSIGHLAESQKDFAVLIKAYAACVKEYGITQKLVIIATGHSNPVLEELAINEEVGELVVFEDSQANLYNWMANSSLFIFCSRYEGVPVMLSEALLLGCPVISTSAPTGVKEILMNGKCGMIVPQGDVDSLCEAMYALHSDTGLQGSFRNNAQEVVARSGQKNMIREFESLLV